MRIINPKSHYSSILKSTLLKMRFTHQIQNKYPREEMSERGGILTRPSINYTDILHFYNQIFHHFNHQIDPFQWPSILQWPIVSRFLVQILIIYLYIRIYMNQTNFLRIYLRKTNGTGQRIIVNPQISCKLLYSLTCQTLNSVQKSFRLFYKGQQIPESAEINMQKLKIQSDSIIHVQPQNQLTQNQLKLKIFCEGNLYSYKAYRNSTFSQFKAEISKMLGCDIKNITTSYLGKVTEDSQIFDNCGIKQNDLISVVISTPVMRERTPIQLKPKLTESVTLATSQQIDLNNHHFPRQLMRKSSMKSSHESRQLQSKYALQVIRPKSQTKLSNDEMKESSQSFNIFKHPWLSSQKMIQTESINFDDPQAEQDPQNWEQCKIELNNTDNNYFLAIECNQKHDLQSVLKILAKAQRKQVGDIKIVFGDENSQKMAEQGVKIIQIARINNTKIIHQVIVNFTQRE